MTFEQEMNQKLSELSNISGITFVAKYSKLKQPIRGKHIFKMKFVQYPVLRRKNTIPSVQERLNYTQQTWMPLYAMFDYALTDQPIDQIKQFINDSSKVYFTTPYNKKYFKKYDLWGQGRASIDKQSMFEIIDGMKSLFQYIKNFKDVLTMPTHIELDIRYMENVDMSKLTTVYEENTQTIDKNFLKIRKVFKPQLSSRQAYPYTTIIQFMYVARHENTLKDEISALIDNIRSMCSDDNEDIIVDLSSETISMLDTSGHFTSYGNPVARIYFKNIDDAMLLFPFAFNENILSIKTEHRIGELI